MIKSRKTVQIACSPQDVWNFITNFDTYPQWVTDVIEVHVNPGPVGVGTLVNEVRQYGNRRYDGVEEVVEWEPYSRFRLKTPSGTFLADALYTLEQTTGGTLLHYSVQIEGHRLGKLLELFIRRNFQGLVDREFSRLKAALETIPIAA